MKRYQHFCGILSVLIISGCATTPEENLKPLTPLSYQLPSAALDNNADIINDANLIFVRQTGVVPLLAPINVSVNNVKVATLHANQFSAVKVEPGEYEVKYWFSILWGGNSRKSRVTVTDSSKSISEINTIFGSSRRVSLDGAPRPALVATCCEYVTATDNPSP